MPGLRVGVRDQAVQWRDRHGNQFEAVGIDDGSPPSGTPTRAVSLHQTQDPDRLYYVDDFGTRRYLEGSQASATSQAPSEDRSSGIAGDRLVWRADGDWYEVTGDLIGPAPEPDTPQNFSASQDMDACPSEATRASWDPDGRLETVIVEWTQDPNDPNSWTLLEEASPGSTQTGLHFVDPEETYYYRARWESESEWVEASVTTFICPS